MSIVGIVAHGVCVSGLISTVWIVVSSCVIASIFGMVGWACVASSSGLWWIGLARLMCIVLLSGQGVHWS